MRTKEEKHMKTKTTTTMDAKMRAFMGFGGANFDLISTSAGRSYRTIIETVLPRYALPLIH